MNGKNSHKYQFTNLSKKWNYSLDLTIRLKYVFLAFFKLERMITPAFSSQAPPLPFFSFSFRFY